MRGLAISCVLGACALAAAPAMTNLNPATKPSSRTGSALVAAVGADGGEQEVLFGGNALFNTNAQTWTYSPNNWSQRMPTVAPSARAWHSMTWDVTQKRAILFGGSAALAGPLRNDTWAFDPVTDTWVQLTNMGTPPSPRFLAVMIYVPHLQRHFLFAGGTATSNNAEATAIDNNIWSLSVNAMAGTATWTPLTPGGTLPPARASACFGYDPLRHRLIVFGGEIVNDTLADTIEYDVDANTWFAITPAGAPTKRGSAVCTFDQRTSKFVMYGGVTTPSGNPISAAYEYDPSNVLWRAITPMPTAGTLTFAAPTYSPDAGGMMFFGGRTSAIGTSQATWTVRLNGTPRVVLPTPLTLDESVMSVLPATGSDVDAMDTLTWNWTQDGGAPITLSSTSVAQPTFTTPAVTAPQQFRFSVVLSDGVETATAFVDVNVRDNVNELPSVDAGPDQFVDAGTTVQLSGSADDPNLETMTYSWAQTSGPAVSLSQSTVLNPTFVAPAQGGVVVLRLTATDSRLGAGFGSVSIDVQPPPVIDAGVDAGSTSDAGSSSDAGSASDGGASDAGPSDAGDSDAGEADAGTPDGGMDAGVADAGDADAGSLDAGSLDVGALDAGDGGEDAGTSRERRLLTVGCASVDVAPFSLLLIALASRKKRRPSPRPSPR